MKKKLNTQAITNELKEGSVFFKQSPVTTTTSQPEPKSQNSKQKKSRTPQLEKKRDQSKQKHSQSVGRLTDQSTDRSTDQSVDQPTQQLTGKVVDRPVSFYIPIVINQHIDEAVNYYRETFSKSIDRSAVVSALLGNPKTWTKEALDVLAEDVISQLTSRLIGRQTSRSTD